jgi:uncharacterized protein YutE (UPF0331/DUF86 family)
VTTVLQKSALVDAMLAGIATLPLESPTAFARDPRDAAAAESYVRRALEALLDLGRHILSKGLGQGALEYKQVAIALRQAGVLDEQSGGVLLEMAGYRNRLVHFYDEVGAAELYEICAHRLGDVRAVREALLAWLRDHPERVDGAL